MNIYQKSIVGMVSSYVGCTLTERFDELTNLVARGVDDPKKVAGWLKAPQVSDCGLFALGIWSAVGVVDELLMRPYETGKAISWLVRIAYDRHAVRRYPHDGPPVAGALMHYFSYNPDGSHRNNDHVEFCLTEPTSQLHADHAGGGRSAPLHNAITMANGLITWSSGRFLRYWYDPFYLLGPGEDTET